MEPKRLRDSGDASPAARLLRASSVGGPDAESTQRVRRALGIGVPVVVAGAVGTGAAAKAAGLSTGGKWLGALVFVTAGMGGGALVLQHMGTSTGAAPTESLPAPAANQADVVSLSAEVAALDAIRHDMNERQFARALSRLQMYRERFPRAALHPESLLLQNEALRALGRVDEANSIAREFLSRYPNSPLAERFKSRARP